MKKDERKNVTPLTSEERAALQARLDGLNAERKSLKKALDADAALKAAAEPTDVVVDDTDKVEETPTEEVPVVDAPVADDTPADVVTDDTDKVEEVPTEEVPVVDAPVADDTPADVVVDDTDKVEETPTEDVKPKKKKGFWKKALAWVAGVALVAALVTILINSWNPAPPVTGSSESESVTESIVDSTIEEFSIENFKAGTNNLIDYYGGTKEDKSDLVLIVEKISSSELEKLVNEFGELTVQENLAHLIVFGDDAMMSNYIVKNELQYNPNYTSDYFDEIDRINAVYTDATGRNASDDLKALDGYSVAQGNKEATIALIGDNAELLNWYTAKCAADEKLYAEIADTKTADAYKEEINLDFVSSNGTINLLKAMLGTTEFELGTLSEEYNQFMAQNYKLVVIGK